VAVHDLTIHPRENDLVLGTYGRALWVGNMQVLRELGSETLAQPAYLFEIKPTTRYNFGTQGMNYALGGDKYLRVPNEPEALTVNYWLGAEGTTARLTVSDTSGVVVRQVAGTSRRGLNRVVIPFVPGGGRGRGGRGAADPAGSSQLQPGRYTVTLEAAGLRLTKAAVVRERIH
jgi:hypothetical protein